MTKLGLSQKCKTGLTFETQNQSTESAILIGWGDKT